MENIDSPILVDTLSFTFQLSVLKNFEAYFGDRFPLTPFPDVFPQGGDVREFQQIRQEAYEDRLRYMMSGFFGMALSPATGRGRHGYYDHCRLMDDAGEQDFGFIAFGGNRGTCHVYLNAHACKSFFERKKPLELNDFLANVLLVTRLNRLDLAYDDYSGVTSTDTVIQAYDRDAFYRGRGVRPRITVIRSRTANSVEGDTVYIGSRRSQVYWRTYDKNLEQGITRPDTPWVRHEVELKKVSVWLLVDIVAAFAGCNEYARQLVDCHNPSKVRDAVERVSASLDSQIRWGRRLIGKTLRSLIDYFDAPTAIALLMAGERGRLHLTPGEISVYRQALEPEPI